MGDVLAGLAAVDVDLLERALVFEDMGEVLEDAAVEVDGVHLFYLAVDVLLDLVQVVNEADEAGVEVVLVLRAVEELEVVVLHTLDLLDHDRELIVELGAVQFELLVLGGKQLVLLLRDLAAEQLQVLLEVEDLLVDCDVAVGLLENELIQLRQNLAFSFRMLLMNWFTDCSSSLTIVSYFQIVTCSKFCLPPWTCLKKCILPTAFFITSFRFLSLNSRCLSGLPL